MKTKSSIRIVSEETRTRLSKQDRGDLVVSVSGGKDSLACCLRLFEMGYKKEDFKRIFMDTGWESQQTYDYLDELEGTIGKIERIKKSIPLNHKFSSAAREFILAEEERIGRESGFIRAIVQYSIFPSSLRKFCTRKLKIEPFQAWVKEQDNDIINIIGVRREESSSRANVTEWEWNDNAGGYWVWRPIYLWEQKDVIDTIVKAGLVPNRLYLQGFDRVGCYPCIYSRKAEIQNIKPERIALISRIERFIGQQILEKYAPDSKPFLRVTKNKERAGFAYKPMFEHPSGEDTIEEMYAWSRTARGGKQFMLFESDTLEPSCAKWGMCNFTGGG